MEEVVVAVVLAAVVALEASAPMPQHFSAQATTMAAAANKTMAQTEVAVVTVATPATADMVAAVPAGLRSGLCEPAVRIHKRTH